MKDFIRWLVKNDNPFPMVSCVIGIAFFGIILTAVLFSIGWPLGLLGLFGMFFGTPYLMYYSEKKDK